MCYYFVFRIFTNTCFWKGKVHFNVFTYISVSFCVCISARSTNSGSNDRYNYSGNLLVSSSIKATDNCIDVAFANKGI